MTEFKLTIEAPELSSAITALANAIANRPAVSAVEKPATRTRTRKPVETPADVSSGQAKEHVVQNKNISSAVVEPVDAILECADCQIPAPAVVPAISSDPITLAQPVVPVQTSQPVPVAPVAPVAPAAPVAPVAPTFTSEMIANAGAELLGRGMMPQLMSLLQKFGVQAVTQLKQEQYPAFAAELRALGANI